MMFQAVKTASAKALRRTVPDMFEEWQGGWDGWNELRARAADAIVRGA